MTDDLISRQVAIDALNEYFAMIGRLKRKGLTKGEEAISLDTVGVIKTLPSVRQEQRWIPLTKRPPEEDVVVIVNDDEGKIRFDACGTEVFTGKRFWFYSKKVVAWMPLPKPYKEDEDAEIR